MGSLRLDRCEAVAAALLRFVSGLRPVPIYGDHCSGFVDRRYRDRRYDLPCICPRSYLGAHIARISRSSRWAANHLFAEAWELARGNYWRLVACLIACC